MRQFITRVDGPRAFTAIHLFASPKYAPEDVTTQPFLSSMQYHLPAPSPLPPNVWSIIISFLLPEERLCLYGVNKDLFDLSMAERYRKVCFNGDKKMKWLCKNIAGEHVRRYVRTIEIRPWQIKEKAAEQQSWVFRWSILRLLTRRDDEWWQKSEERRKQRKYEKAIKRISEAVKSLPNVQEYNVHCPQDNYHSQLIQGLIPTLSNWEHSLTKLTLCVPPDTLLCLPRVTLARLENLELVFWAKPAGMFLYNVLEPLTVFVNNLHRTLQSLSVMASRSAAGVDLVPIFKNLGVLPRLRHFELSMPFDGSSFSRVDPLLSFLRNHKRLQALKLGTKPAPARQSPTSQEQKEWIIQILRCLDNTFGDLQHINVALRPLKAKATLLALINFLSVHGHNLTSLVLSEDKSLSFAEVQEILQPRTQFGFYHLQHLAFDVHIMNPELFRFLATNFLNLKHLEIGFQDFTPGHTFDTFCEGLRENRLSYADWSLKHIDFPSESGRAQDWSRFEMQRALKECIPTLNDVTFL